MNRKAMSDLIEYIESGKSPFHMLYNEECIAGQLANMLKIQEAGLGTLLELGINVETAKVLYWGEFSDKPLSKITREETVDYLKSLLRKEDEKRSRTTI